MTRHTADGHEIGQDCQDGLTVEPPSNLDRQALTGELVYDCKHTELPSIPCSILDEVVCPDMVRALGPQPNTRPVIQPEPTPLWLLLRNPKALPPPNPRNTLVVHIPPVSAKQRSDPAIPVPAVSAGELNNCGGERVLVIELLRFSPLGRAVLSHDTASSTLGYAKFVARVFYELTATGGPYQFPDAASFRIALSSSASARRRFNLAFSFSRSFRRFA